METQTVKMFCQHCSKEIPQPSSFRTRDALRLYFVTGQCQECQDSSSTTAVLMRAYVTGRGTVHTMTAQERQDEADDLDRDDRTNSVNGQVHP